MRFHGADKEPRFARIAVGNFAGAGPLARMRGDKGSHPGLGIIPGRAFLKKPDHRDRGVTALPGAEAVPSTVAAIYVEAAKPGPVPIVTDISIANVVAENDGGDRRVPCPRPAGLLERQAHGLLSRPYNSGATVSSSASKASMKRALSASLLK